MRGSAPNNVRMLPTTPTRMSDGYARNGFHLHFTELETDIRKWSNEWNNDPKPFVWTKIADEILETRPPTAPASAPGGNLAQDTR